MEASGPGDIAARPLTSASTEALFDYHPIDALIKHYTVRANTAKLDMTKTNQAHWTCAFVQRRSGKSCTLTVVQSSRQVDYMAEKPFDALINLSIKKGRHAEVRADFTPLALVISAARATDDLVRDWKDWTNTTKLSSAVDKERARATAYSEALIKSTTRMLALVLDQAIAAGHDQVSVLMTCDMGRERSLLFLISWMTVADMMVKHEVRDSARATPGLKESQLAYIQSRYNTLIFDELLKDLALLKERATDIYRSLCVKFPLFYLTCGIVAQGNKRVIDLTDEKYTGALTLNPVFTCSHCAAASRAGPNTILFYDDRSCNVYCSQVCSTIRGTKATRCGPSA